MHSSDSSGGAGKKNASPLVLGSIFEGGLSGSERRRLGVHYTIEPLVLRVLGPLFLDELESTLFALRDPASLDAFVDGLAEMHCFDPACGAGSFLVVAYQRIRRLETEALARRRACAGEGGARALEGKVALDRFCGIELDERAATLCRDALLLAEDIENRAAALRIEGFRRTASGEPRIVAGNALALAWGDVLAPDRASYVFGNPPFVGMAWMSPEQQEERSRVFAALRAADLRTGRLDYVASWYAKAMLYAEGFPIRMAFVSTNSLTQGEQARSMGPLLARHGYRLDFAHRTFHWASEARGKANVHVVVLGFSKRETGPRRLFDYPDPRGEPVETSAQNINIWLADAPDVSLEKRARPLLPGSPIGTKGSQPTDGNHLIVEPEEHAAVMADPIAAKYVRRYVQARDFLRGKPRFCLWLEGATPADLQSSAILKARIEAVRRVRLASRTRSVREKAEMPSLFTQIRQPSVRYLALPEVSSENRRVIPAAFLDPDVIAGNKLITFPGADLWLFGMLQSSMFMAWVRAVAGRMKSDISISPHLTYNTFPFFEPSAAARGRVLGAAEGVLSARNNHGGASLGELYEPRKMPADLAAAHDALDWVVDSLFGAVGGFRSDAERMAASFARYSALTRDDPQPGQ